MARDLGQAEAELDFQHEADHEDSKVCTCAKVCTDTESSVVGSLSMGLATVEGGAVSGAARVDRESGVWAITVTPDTREALSISLPPASDWEADGAVCTSDGRALSIGAAHIVTGQADQPERNTAATGTPTISGTPQLGDELTTESVRVWVVGYDGMTFGSGRCNDESGG